MKLPDNPDLQKWLLDKGIDIPDTNPNVNDGDLELKKKTLQCMIALMALTKISQERTQRIIVGHSLLNLILLAVIFGMLI